jgi:SWI/SNF-related matrix-associated actin-dependent regulator 1 of chromatin subfamily A
MEIVEYPNKFHIFNDFGRFKNSQLSAIKSIKYGDDRQVATYDWKAKAWVVPISFKNVVYAIGEKYRAKHVEIKTELPQNIGTIPAMPKLDPSFMYELPGNRKLRSYQEEGVARGLQLKRFINGDQPGLGKTAQSIVTLAAAEKQGNITFPCLVICPSALKINWFREFSMWSNKKSLILTTGTKDTWHRWFEMEQADVFIVNYESLKKYFVKSLPKTKTFKSAEIVLDERVSLFKSIIVDESHKLKDSTTLQTKITAQIAKGKEWTILLTGTPVVNKPIDLWAQIAILYKLNCFGGPDYFKTRYCEGGRGAANLQELNYMLNMHCFFQRNKAEVLKDLPELTRQEMTVSISNKEEYKRVKNDFANFLQNSDFTDSEIRKKLSAEVIVKMTMLLGISARGKIDAACEFIDEIIGSGQKLVIAITHNDVVELLQKKYPKAVCVTGKQNGLEKQRSVDAFQNDPKTNIIIVNYKAGGVGITLTASSEVLMLELPWTYADCDQMEARCHRMGQRNSVRATYLLGEGTLDEWMYQLIQEKKLVANTVTGAVDDIPVSTLNKVLDLFKNN